MSEFDAAQFSSPCESGWISVALVHFSVTHLSVETVTLHAEIIFLPVR
jgi:hypothetical protein